MNVFLSYSHTDAGIAASLAARLRAEGHDVFWDHTSLPSGESFDDRIRDAIEDSDLFVCLISRESLNEGKYARTELKFAEQKWPNPSGNVLPVVLDAEAMKTIPPYLKAVTVERPQGEPVAEIVAEVERIAKNPMRRLIRWGRIAAVLVAAVGAGWIVFHWLYGNPIEFTVRMSGLFYSDSVGTDALILQASTDYVKLLKRGLRGDEHADGRQLFDYLEKDKTEITSPLPVIHFGIVNNSDKTVVVDRLRLMVHESRIDEQPLLWGSSTLPGTNHVINGSFMLGNNGWGAASDIVLKFDLVAEHELSAAGKRTSRQFEKKIPALSNGATTIAAFWDELATFGTNVSFLKDGLHPMGSVEAMARFAEDVTALKAALGVSRNERFFAIGELSYSWGTQQLSRLSFQQELQIVYPGHIDAPAMLARVGYDIELKSEGTNYNVERQIAHSIEPGATEAIDLRVWCDESSLHTITTLIRVGEEWIDACDTLRLEYYRPFGSHWVRKSQ